MAVNSEKLNESLGKAMVGFGVTFHVALGRVGGKLGPVQDAGAVLDPKLFEEP